jgi:hypothetical protein
MALRCDMISAGCNRDPETADWNHELDLVAYAASSTVAMYDPGAIVVRSTIRGHQTDPAAPLNARINALRWLPRQWAGASRDVDVGVGVGVVVVAAVRWVFCVVAIASSDTTVAPLCPLPAQTLVFTSSSRGPPTLPSWCGATIPSLDRYTD